MEYTHEDQIYRIDDLFKTCIAILESKGKEYNPDWVVLQAVDTLASDMGIPSYQVLNIFLNKHLESIRYYMKYGKLESTETLSSRIQDAINYLALIWFDIEVRKTKHENGSS